LPRTFNEKSSKNQPTARLASGSKVFVHEPCPVQLPLIVLLFHLLARRSFLRIQSDTVCDCGLGKPIQAFRKMSSLKVNA